MCLVHDFESLDLPRKGSLIDAAFAEQGGVFSNVCRKVFHEAPREEYQVLRKHIIENYYADA